MKEIKLGTKDIKEVIATKFGPIIIADGFEYKKTNNEYILKKDDCIYWFNILVTSWSTSYSMDVRLWISQKKIENIYELILGKSVGLTLTPEIDRLYHSLDGRKIIKGEGLSIWLTKDEDIYLSIETLEDYYKHIAKPYFGIFKTLEAFDDFINKPPFEYSPAYVGSYTNDRCMKGLIVAKLVSNPDYEKLVLIYDELIKKTLSDVQPNSIINYNKVKDYLASTDVRLL